MIVHRVNTRGLVESVSDATPEEQSRMAHRCATDALDDPQRVREVIAMVRESGIMDTRSRDEMAFRHSVVVSPHRERNQRRSQARNSRRPRFFSNDEVRTIRKLGRYLNARAVAEQMGCLSHQASVLAIIEGRTYTDVKD
jgi:hypothetical protein